MATDLAKKTVAPSETVPLTITIKSFRTFRDSFQELAYVVTNEGELELRISGSLPPIDEVLVRPNVLFISARAQYPLARVVYIRVPQKLGTDLELKESGQRLPLDAKVALSPEGVSGSFRDWRVSISLKTKPPPGFGSGLLMLAGKGVEVRVPIEFETVRQ
jgi:hypothetical protein